MTSPLNARERFRNIVVDETLKARAEDHRGSYYDPTIGIMSALDTYTTELLEAYGIVR